jgi:hypothetical protein
MNKQFFIPTKQEILDLEVGSLAPDYTGKLKPIVKISAKQQDVNGKWFCCYYVKHSENGSVSGDLKEDELHITVPLSNQYKSHELNIIEAQMLKERGVKLPKRLEWCATKSPAQGMSQI